MDALNPLTADVADRHIHGQGTPERSWRRHGRLDTLPETSLASLVPEGSRVVVVAPHPDDEVLGCGGTLAQLARAGREILVLGVTDGEASHPGSRRWPPRRLAYQRRDERAHGLARLGVTTPPLCLGLPDGGVSATEDELTSALCELLRAGDTVLATWRHDGHPDHEAAGRAAAVAAHARACRLREVPVWMWHWAAPGDARVPWDRLRRLPLDVDACERKTRAIGAHASQLVDTPDEGRPPVLPDWALARALRPFEVFFGAEGDA